MSRRPAMPPVGILSPLAPVDHPQMVPSTPMRMPPPGERVSRRITDNLLGGMGAPSSAFGSPDAVPTRTYEPHRYAAITEGNFAPLTTSDGEPFLTMASSRRNFLGFRNSAAAGGANIYISFGREASTVSWLVLSPGQIILFDTVVPQDDVYAIADAAGASLSYAFSTYAPE